MGGGQALGLSSDGHRALHLTSPINQPPILLPFLTQMEGLDLNNDEEKKLVDGIFASAVDCLSGEGWAGRARVSA